jgi:ABC-2 type transport system permease protein
MATDIDTSAGTANGFAIDSRRAIESRVRPQTFGTAIRSEWIKFRTLRSNWIGLATGLVLLIGLASLAAAVSTGTVAPPIAGQGGGGVTVTTGDDPLATVFRGANFTVLLSGILGALAGAREYNSRMIAASVAAVPRRWQIVAAKSGVFSAVAMVVFTVGVFLAFFAGMAVLSGAGAETVALGDADVVRELLGLAVYIAAVGLIGLGLGVMLRSVPGAIGAVVALFMILPPLAGALVPESWHPALAYLPNSAAAAFTTVQAAGTDMLSAGAGAVVLAVWVVATTVGAVVTISRRDV